MGKLLDGTRVTVPESVSGVSVAGEWIVKPVEKLTGSWRSKEWELIFVPAEGQPHNRPHSRSIRSSEKVCSGTRVKVLGSPDGAEGNGEWVVTEIPKWTASWRSKEWELVWTPEVKKASSNSRPSPRKATPAKKAAPRKAVARKAPAKAAPAKKAVARKAPTNSKVSNHRKAA